MNIDKENTNEGDERINTTPENIDSSSEDLGDKNLKIKDDYAFGWSRYAEITNGRFAMIGFLSIIIIELLSHKSFLSWAGIYN